VGSSLAPCFLFPADSFNRYARSEKEMTNSTQFESLPVTMAKSRPDVFPEDFLEWLPENVHIYYAFEQETRKIHDRGFKHYSARTIIEFLRHHSAIKQNSGGEWKINDHCTPYMARLFDLLNPTRAGLFEYRKAAASKKPHNG